MELWAVHFVMGSDSRSGSWHFDDGIIIFPLYLALCCTGGSARVVKWSVHHGWRQASWWGMFIGGVFDMEWNLGKFVHLKLIRSFSSQAMPTLSNSAEYSSSRHCYRELHLGLWLHDRLWGEQPWPTVCWLEQLTQYHYLIVEVCWSEDN